MSQLNEFFSVQHLIELDIHIKIERTKHGEAFPVSITDEEAKKLKANEKTALVVRTLHTKWQMPSWKAANDLLKAATFFNFHKQEMDTDWNKMRAERLNMMLVGWDAKDKDGNPIPTNSETIGQLHQNIALALLKAYDDATKISEEDEKKT